MNNILDTLSRINEHINNFFNQKQQNQNTILTIFVRIIIFLIVFIAGLVILGFTGILQNPL